MPSEENKPEEARGERRTRQAKEEEEDDENVMQQSIIHSEYIHHNGKIINRFMITDQRLCSRKIVLCGNVTNGYGQSNFDCVTSQHFCIVIFFRVCFVLFCR